MKATFRLWLTASTKGKVSKNRSLAFDPLVNKHCTDYYFTTPREVPVLNLVNVNQMVVCLKDRQTDRHKYIVHKEDRQIGQHVVKITFILLSWMSIYMLGKCKAEKNSLSLFLPHVLNELQLFSRHTAFSYQYGEWDTTESCGDLLHDWLTKTVMCFIYTLQIWTLIWKHQSL